MDKRKGEAYKKFYLQDGYDSFSVNPYELAVVMKYVKRQHEHYNKKTFQDKSTGFLKKYNVEYDERYVWD